MIKKMGQINFSHRVSPSLLLNRLFVSLWQCSFDACYVRV
jgi:hypothetical protein